jgi:CHAD domain-containing protein
MAYRLDARQTARAAVLAAIDGQLEGAIESLSVTNPDERPAAIHDARKRLKKARSALRMVRGSLAKATARRLNDELRAIAATLSERRDADVLVETVDALRERFTGRVPATTFEALRDRLAEQASAAGADDDNADQIARLEAVREQLEEADLSRVRWKSVGMGIDRAFRRGRKGYKGASHANTEELHQWRKRAKDLWYHHRLIKDANPSVVAAYAKDAHQLSDRLGDDHDLAVVRATIVHQDPPAATAPVDLDPVVDLIDEHGPSCRPKPARSPAGSTPSRPRRSRAARARTCARSRTAPGRRLSRSRPEGARRWDQLRSSPLSEVDNPWPPGRAAGRR